MTSLFPRATAIWFAILIVAIANGAFRQAVLIPRLGDATAHVLSTLALSAAVLLVAYLSFNWIGAAGSREYWSVGIYWLVLTIAFEFLAGHYLFGTPWHVLLADYKIHEGRIWPLVLVATLVAPTLAAWLHSLGRQSVAAPLN
jgi:hypothetical protein